MLDANQFADLPDFLESCVNKIKKSYPRFSSLQLSKKLGIPNSTFDRIAKKEVKNPSFNYALKIVQEVSTEENIQMFIKNFYPKMYENFESVYPGNKDVPFVVPEAEAYFQDPSTYELLIMATSSEGLTRERTLEEFGRRGLGILDKLITNGILKENNGKVSIEGPINAKQDTVKQVLQNLIKFNYDLDSFGDNKNWLSVQYESVNTEVVIPQLRDICIEANQKIREVMNNPESKGRDVVWAGIAMDSLVKHSDLLINNKKVLQ
ncbi:hypothetical protein M902_1246 [Bacteriovorax sp. BAL6_X]|uniref:hypothetical protein n=1 Tax=Bacteriovorax sp. BAL6_X TaxID=1201290 RepID=UPI000385DA1C|nr:hypothetical protein [Bacteriovorax sp. BAL6_X]EPZ50884.1 hypothetical protein M902_1246 [Bacteriovorax sp. BAL6_X]